MPQCVHRCRRARRSELWPPRYWLVPLFHSHIAQLVAAACRTPFAAPQVAPQCASPVAVSGSALRGALGGAAGGVICGGMPQLD
ncbi:hypothetical protein K1T71_010633 [Dendrolimus kikuchii]|uniref:Uncharacterized protein n=1 Tax=Dendrolimus kikuchii TaxID=765133 RepID=A0ACC1CQ05_9NEOP|nr:hypothetical protein K1T71_010633 [Dendrolimus kikuchii]